MITGTVNSNVKVSGWNQVKIGFYLILTKTINNDESKERKMGKREGKEIRLH